MHNPFVVSDDGGRVQSSNGWRLVWGKALGSSLCITDFTHWRWLAAYARVAIGVPSESVDWPCLMTLDVLWDLSIKPIWQRVLCKDHQGTSFLLTCSLLLHLEYRVTHAAMWMVIAPNKLRVPKHRYNPSASWRSAFAKLRRYLPWRCSNVCLRRVGRGGETVRKNMLRKPMQIHILSCLSIYLNAYVKAVYWLALFVSFGIYQGDLSMYFAFWIHILNTKKIAPSTSG